MAECGHYKRQCFIRCIVTYCIAAVGGSSTKNGDPEEWRCLLGGDPEIVTVPMSTVVVE